MIMKKNEINKTTKNKEHGTRNLKRLRKILPYNFPFLNANTKRAMALLLLSFCYSFSFEFLIYLSSTFAFYY